MRISLLSGLLPLLLVSCQGTTTKVEIDPDVGYKTEFTIDRKTGKHHGPYIKRDTSGILLEKGNLKNGIPHGIRELYYPDGQVKVRERYVDGRLDDLYEYFHPNGVAELKGYYIDGEMYGLWRKYTKEGQLVEEVLMIHNEENGPFTEYFPNGKIQAEGAYLHGPNEDGTLKLYDESGELYKTMLCKEGRCYTKWIRE
jgi:antitoxin component YwqK of YwqJK toxin-antitoxin module